MFVLLNTVNELHQTHENLPINATLLYFNATTALTWTGIAKSVLVTIKEHPGNRLTDLRAGA